MCSNAAMSGMGEGCCCWRGKRTAPRRWRMNAERRWAVLAVVMAMRDSGRREWFGEEGVMRPRDWDAG